MSRWNRRWAVLPVVAVAVAAGASAMLLLGGDDEPEASTLRAPTAQVSGGLFRGAIDLELEILRESGIVETVSGNQPWRVVSEIHYAGVPSAQTAKRFDISWKQPVSSTGPWLAVQCRGTRQVVSEWPWDNATTVSVIIDPAGHEILQLSVKEPPAELDSEALPRPEPGLPSPDDYHGPLRLRDLPNGEWNEVSTHLNAEQRLEALECPPGLEDD